MAEGRRGATAAKWKCYHGNIPVPVIRLRYRCKGEVCGCVHGWWGDPRFRVSHIMVAWLTANVQGTIRTWCKHGHLIHYMHSSMGIVPAGIPLKRAFSRRNEFGGNGSSCSRVAEGSSGTRSFFGEVLDEPNIFGATVVVHGRRGTCRSGLGEDVLGESA